MTAVELRRVEKMFGSNRVVQALDLEVRDGEFLSLLGPSGCGKTTTLRMMAGLERATSGEIWVGGACVDGGKTYVAPEHRGLGMVFQSYAIWPHLSVFDNVVYPLRLRRVATLDAEKRVKQALGWVRLESLAERMPHALSGGQLQRVALARALVADPKVLLLDEPLSNLDAALREELRAELASLRARLGTTMVYVTHDQSEALALSDRIAVMSGGAIEQLDAPRTVYDFPKTAFVAKFVGGTNLLSGEVVGTHFHLEGVSFPLPTDHAPGKARLAVRPEDVQMVTEGGTPLTVATRLFLGPSTELRFAVGAHHLKAVVPGVVDVRPGEMLQVRLAKLTLFPDEAK